MVKTERVVRVWRVEDKYGCGPYRDDDSYHLIVHHFSGNGHPSPYYDDGIRRDAREDELCGFISLKQAKEWFSDKELDGLSAEGFKLRRVIAREITKYGEKQILFKRGKI